MLSKKILLSFLCLSFFVNNFASDIQDQTKKTNIANSFKMFFGVGMTAVGLYALYSKGHLTKEAFEKLTKFAAKGFNNFEKLGAQAFGLAFTFLGKVYSGSAAPVTKENLLQNLTYNLDFSDCNFEDSNTDYQDSVEFSELSQNTFSEFELQDKLVELENDLQVNQITKQLNSLGANTMSLVEHAQDKLIAEDTFQDCDGDDFYYPGEIDFFGNEIETEQLRELGSSTMTLVENEQDKLIIEDTFRDCDGGEFCYPEETEFYKNGIERHMDENPLSYKSEIELNNMFNARKRYFGF